MSKALLSVIIACHGDGKELDVMLSCLEMQMIYAPAPHSRRPQDMIPYAKAKPWPDETFPNLEVVLSWDGAALRDQDKRLTSNRYNLVIIENPPQKGVGHNTRGPGIREATGEWIVLSNMDNYFMLGWLHQILPALKDADCGMIFWGWISNLQGWKQMIPNPRIRGKVDLQCCAVRSDVAKAVGFNGRAYDYDFDFINQCFNLTQERGRKIKTLPNVLCVHN